MYKCWGLTRQFIWDSSNGTRKISLVDWSSICQPRSCGGFGFRHLEDQNSTFLLKLRFNLVSKDDALWDQVLWANYRMKDKIPESITRGNCLAVWRALAKVWHLLCENLCWYVGTRNSIRCWGDPWSPNVGPLINYVPSHNNNVLECLLCDMVFNDGAWNLNLFRVWLSEDIIKRIVSFPPLHLSARTDRINWIDTFIGAFYVKSAYRSLRESS